MRDDYRITATFNLKKHGRYKMKKITIAILSLCMVISFTTMALATGAENNSTGGTLTIVSDTGPGLTFNPSPSTVMSSFTSGTEYTIIAASSKTTADNGIEYGVVSSSNSVYQMKQATKEVCQTAAATLPTGFKDKAGTGAPQS